jgi:uncharacterized protein YndB with AHSA1/START domain
MSPNDLVARATTTIDASKEDVWKALTDPELISRYMFGTKVSTDWGVGSPITWAGEWEGKSYEDKGTVREVVPPQILEYSHFSPLTGQPDLPENYHTVRIEVIDDEGVTKVILTQDNNDTSEARDHSEKNWQSMLHGLREVVEASS